MRTIRRDEVLDILSLRTEVEALSTKLAGVREELRDTENRILDRLEAGARVRPDCPALAVKVEERRNVAWRTAFEAVLGKAAALKVVAETSATFYKRLVIGEG